MPTFTSLVGANPLRRTTASEFKLGTPALADDNTSWVYAQASAAVAKDAVVILSGTFTVATGAGNYTATGAFANGEYGWVKKTASPL